MKPGRNDPCPCGSGRKYKQCCAATGVAVQAPRVDVPQTLNAALAAHRLGQLQQAAMLYQQVLRVQPQHSGALHMLGVVAHQGGQLDAAVELLGRALAVRPSVAQAHLDLANVLKDQGRLQEAAASYRRALVLEAELDGAHTGLGNALMAQGHFGEAGESYRRAVKLSPHSADAHYNLGNAEAAQGRLDEAAALYRQALALQPEHFGALNNLGNALAEQGRPGEAADIFTQLLAVRPDFAGAYNNLGRALSAQGRLQEAAAAFRRGLAINPQDAEAHSNLLYLLNYDADCDAETLFAEHLGWARQHAEALGAGAPHANDPDPARRIRVGYVSPDLRDHAVAYFIEPVLARHDRSRFEITCYSNNPVVDATTQRLQKHADRWRNIAGLSDEAADALIRADAIDILIDLSGHTAHNRLTLFARKPAPVQATWIGYPNTTGMSAMDYRLTDANLDPPGMTERYHSEQLVRLPVSACFSPAAASPEVGELPALATGHITFACLNNFTKVTPPTIECWARVLDAVPGSRLMLLLGDAENPAARQQVEQAFARHGIAPERLELVGKRPLADYLALHHRIDIALDPFPYNGGTTSVHSLWMGVPVVTLAGKTAVSRVGVTILANAGLAKLIAQSVDEYVEIARRLAADTARLGKMRAELRAQMQASPLFDAEALTRALEDAYRNMWETWCANKRNDRLAECPTA